MSREQSCALIVRSGSGLWDVGRPHHHIPGSDSHQPDCGPEGTPFQVFSTTHRCDDDDDEEGDARSLRSTILILVFPTGVSRP